MGNSSLVDTKIKAEAGETPPKPQEEQSENFRKCNNGNNRASNQRGGH
nr:MAG TPA: hypothetical protein [Caudoviricetes sp.]